MKSQEGMKVNEKIDTATAFCTSVLVCRLPVRLGWCVGKLYGCAGVWVTYTGVWVTFTGVWVCGLPVQVSWWWRLHVRLCWCVGYLHS